MKCMLLVHCCQLFCHRTLASKKTEEPLAITWQQCDSPGSCSDVQGAVVLDSNWRWTHIIDDYVNCYTGNEWDPEYCPDAATCTTNCAIDGVDAADWESTYGGATNGAELSLKFVSEGPYSRNVGSRTYLLDEDLTNYRIFNLLNKEFTFDVNDAELGCGLNGALYFVEMQADGGLADYETNMAGAQYGTGYCDAQCPHDVKWINGEANMEDWSPSETDENAGFGKYGTCCGEMDIWEANSQSQAYTSHPCTIESQYRCEGQECGDNASDERYDGVCDKDGCDYASFRLGDQTFWGPGSEFTVDSSQVVTVVTQFITADGTDTGELIEIRRKYVQNGNVIENSVMNVDGFEAYDSITEDFCQQYKIAFNDYDDHTIKGGLKVMGESLARGHVLVMSLWDDHEANMLWLDSNYPPDCDPEVPGCARGPCPEDSGLPSDVESEQGDSTVYFSNIKFGCIDCTY